MVKVCAQGENVAECTGPSGITYKRDKGGIFHMTESDAAVMAKGGGFYPSMAGTTRRDIGFRCADCGYGSYFKTCGRCGGACGREGGDE
jgi:hypothetical protein